MARQARVKQLPNQKAHNDTIIKSTTKGRPVAKVRIKKEEEPQQKLGRGFKKCQQCQKQMHIHKKECSSCHFIQSFSSKFRKENNNQEIVNDVLAKAESQPKGLSKLKKDKIFVINKSLLKDAINNKDDLLMNNIQQRQIYVESVMGNTLHFQNDRKFILDGLEIESMTFIKVDDANIIYIGAPILGLAVKQNMIAVSIQLNQYEGQLFAQLHQINKKYDGLGLILLIENQVITQIEHQYGSSLQLKFNPLQDLLGSINSDGSFAIITNTVKAVQDGFFSCFDWCYSSECILALGSQDGNLSIYKFDSQFTLINYIDNHHFGTIKDIQFYYHNDSQMSLLATGGYDGNLKIINPMQNTAIFDENICTKGILSVKWDIGGKYIVVLKDELHHRAQLVSFFSVIRELNQKHTLHETEQRFIHQLAGDDFTISIGASYESQNMYFGSNFGVVYKTSFEQIRKQAIKKEKKMINKSDEFHKGQISIYEGQVKYDSNFTIDQSTSKASLSDWTKSYQYIEVSDQLVAMANILGILVIKQINN